MVDQVRTADGEYVRIGCTFAFAVLAALASCALLAYAWHVGVLAFWALTG